MKNQSLEKIFGKNMRFVRRQKKITQEALAETTGIDYKYIQRIEGQGPPNITLKTLQKIAQSLKVSPHSLLK